MIDARTKYSYSVGCIGRDMAYTLVNTYLLYYLTNGLGLDAFSTAAVGVIMLVARLWDAINDPMMGTIVDNTRTRWGKFKPWILTGALVNSIITYLLFTDFGLTGVPFLVLFTFIYILWGMSYTINDIPYWSLLPSLSTDQKDREKIGSLARLFANVGLFVVTAAVPLVISLFPTVKAAYKIIVPITLACFILCQALVIWGVKEKKNLITGVQNKSNLKTMFKVIFKNDQLLFIVLSILLFSIGYFITTSFGMYFFDYDYRGLGTGAFTIFAIILGLSQTAALLVFPQFAKKFTRKQLFTAAIIMVAIGYLGFMAVGYILPMHMVTLGIIGFVLFSGQAFIQILVLMMLADTIEYGQWKLGTRNESAVFALQPFVNKMAGAIQVLVTTLTLALSGLSTVNEKVAAIPEGLTGAELDALRTEIMDSVTGGMLLSMRLVMIIVPLILIIASYFVYILKYKIDKPMYEKILVELNERAAAQNPADGGTDAAQPVSDENSGV